MFDFFGLRQNAQPRSTCGRVQVQANISFEVTRAGLGTAVVRGAKISRQKSIDQCLEETLENPREVSNPNPREVLQLRTYANCHLVMVFSLVKCWVSLCINIIVSGYQRL